MSLRILITNNRLAERAGSELYVHDLALALLGQGHSPIAYSSVLGEVAADLARATVPVISDLAALQIEPDVIHGQHHLETMSAVLRFPRTPAVYVCHGWAPWEEQPPVFPSIRRYIAVDDLCRERLETTPGISPDRIRTVYNAVDLTRFLPRAPLPARPRAALIFSNYAADAGFIDAIRSACAAHGIARVDILGRAAATSVAAPERVLPEYDVVFAKARCALEAMAVGCAVIVADYAGLGGMVTPANAAPLRRLNFGVRTMQGAAVTAERVSQELARYDAAGSAAVSAFIRQQADAAPAFARMAALYDEALAEPIDWSAAAGRQACAAASAYLAGLAAVVKNVGRTTGELACVSDRLTTATAALAAVEARATAAGQARTTAESELARTRAALTATIDTMTETQRILVATTQQLTATTRELAAVWSSTTWRLFAPYRRLRAWCRRPLSPHV